MIAGWGNYVIEPRSDGGITRSPTFFPKWRHFVAACEEFYARAAGVSFSPDEPWTLFEMPELAVVVAGLNSTMAESHRDDDHYGWVGEQQLRWFAERLATYRERGWLRLAAVHHNVVRVRSWTTRTCAMPTTWIASLGSRDW